jgi:muramoyltetrapeptide carboxypeptidase
LIAPPKLKPGDKVGLVSPARWSTDAHIQALVSVLERNGLEPVLHPQLKERGAGQLAGSDDQRADAFNDLLRDPAIRGIFFPRAGTGSYRILDKIDYQAAATDPKIIIGFSDVDILLAAISARSGIVTFRGPVGVSFTNQNIDPRTESDCFELLTGARTSWEWTGAVALHGGSAEGELVGGNLAVLNAAIGTPFDVDTSGKIVIIEECDELLFRLDRFLYQAAQAGKFAHAKAVLFGTIENMLDGEQHDGSGNRFGKDVPEMLRDFIPAHIPLVYGLPLGHGPYLSSHPIGARARVEITAAATTMRLLEPTIS